MRNRTPKTLGTRHEPSYVHRPTAFGKWRFWLGLGITIGAAAVLLAAFPLKSKGTIYSKVYSKGPVSSAHSFIAEKCELCHWEGGNHQKPVGFFQKLMHGPADEACLRCHEAPVHHQGSNQPAPPSCASCHMEHQGRHALFRLSHVQDRACVNCHGNLDEKKNNAAVQPKKARYIHKFDSDHHPEFVAASERMMLLDRNICKSEKKEYLTGIVFHHAKHVGPTLETLNHKFVILNCSDCHRPMAAENYTQWTYRRPGLKLATTAPGTSQVPHPDAGREVMSMPTYEKNCAGCHAIPFDGHFSDTDSAPHLSSNDEPELKRLHKFITDKLQTYIDSYPGAIRIPDPPVPGFPRVPEMQPLPLASGPKEWVEQRVARAEKDVLAAVKCRYCHQMDAFKASPPDLARVPVVKPSGFKPRQMPFSVFSHDAHLALTCGSCHDYQPTLQPRCEEYKKNPTVLDPDIPDVKLPGVKTCEICHNGNPAYAGQTENSCFLCHQYHKWNERTGEPGKTPTKYDLTQLGLSVK